MACRPDTWPWCMILYVFTPQLSCWPSHRHSLTQRNMAPIYWLWQFCFISGTSWLFNLTFSSSHWSRWWSCSHFLIIPEIQTFPLSQLISTWIFWTKLSTDNKETIFLNIYRPPSSKISTFLDKFRNLLEIFVPSPSELIISGDFNIHADSDQTTSHKFSGILDNFHLTQHINFPTHDDGHTLDLLIARSSSTVITHLSLHESYQFDHKSFTFKFFQHIRPTT